VSGIGFFSMYFFKIRVSPTMLPFLLINRPSQPLLVLYRCFFLSEHYHPFSLGV